jgi:hypothetical protein
MMRIYAALYCLMLTVSMPAMASEVAPDLSGVAFLTGEWVAGKGVVADTGGTSTGRSIMSAEAGGHVLLRRDHTDLFDPSGKPAGGFDQIMMIYPEGGTLRADYSDGSHVIHYDHAEIEPRRSVTFTSVARPGQPVFRLSYFLSAPDRIAIAFAVQPPGSSTFQPIANGILTRAH